MIEDGILARQHISVSPLRCTRVTSLPPQIYIKDVKSSNGMFINGERLSGEGLESEPFELKSDNIIVSRLHLLPTSYTAA